MKRLLVLCGLATLLVVVPAASAATKAMPTLVLSCSICVISEQGSSIGTAARVDFSGAGYGKNQVAAFLNAPGTAQDVRFGVAPASDGSISSSLYLVVTGDYALSLYSTNGRKIGGLLASAGFTVSN